MTTPISIVESFIAGWAPNQAAMYEAFRRYFTAQTVWENVGVATTTGIDEAIGFFEGFPMKIDHIKVDMLAIAANGNVVLTERIDHLCGKDGKILLSLKLMGIFEVQGGKISKWRDYFDTATLFKMMQG